MEKLTNNKSILDWVQTRIDLLQPDKVVWIDGSKEQIQALKDEAVSTGEFIKLNEEKLPDCYFHRTNPNDVARVEDRTFICTPTKEEAGPLNNWMDPDEAYKMCDDIIRGSYKGKTMYVIPYSMCKVGSPFAKYGLEVTDSIYRRHRPRLHRRDQGYPRFLQFRPREEIHQSVAAGQHHLLRQLLLRRQRPSGQEVLRAPYRIQPGPPGRLAG